ncbi:MAG: bifunctional diguanylate cyclase/phosphodiesterase [Alphaproteobacteria bacterium]|nr:bifunctional diguanylate cyclase/phosphodiesterase [Alphaproteobacteria bacterium]
MPTRRSLFTEFAFRILVPSLVSAAGIWILLIYIVDGIFDEANRLDAAYAKRSASSAISLLKENLETVVQDNAVWDEATNNTRAVLSTRWLDNTWGVTTAGDSYNAIYVVDPAGHTLYAARDGHRTSEDVVKVMGSDIKSLLDNLPNDGVTFDKASGLVKIGQAIHAVVAGTIVPATSEMAPGPGNRLVMTKVVDRDVLTGLSQRFVLDDMHITDGTAESSQSISLISPSGVRIATLAWSDRSPGKVVKSKFGNLVNIILTMFLFVIGILIHTSWKGFRDAHRSQAEAISASMRDDLTGLANRRQLMAVLTECLAEARSKGTGLSVVYADLDGFKEVNDSYGHEIGDLLLKSAAGGFAHLAQDAHLVARLGGDEFAILFIGPDSELRSRNLARNMIAFLSEPMHFEGRVASVSVSVGIVDMGDGDADVEEIIRRADVAMYAAKTAGRNRLHVYEKSLDFKRDENRSIARDLRQHIDRRALTVVYQPIVDARSRRILGVEALVRWPKDARVHYTPDKFIPVAEEFGLIEDLGYFVLTEACRQAAQWDSIFVAVNVSPIQFMNPGFAELVEKVLMKTGLEPSRLEVEVTEGFIIDSAERANSVINRLHDMRVGVALDDFGTGFSSIGHLRRFKFDKLKLDRSMVSDILRQPAALRLVQGTIAMADALGLIVVAEGIEDENQVSVLRLAGCSQFQGFLFSRPVDAGQIGGMLAPDANALAG